MEFDEEPRHPVIVAALEYESATLDALEALGGTDGDAQIAACVRFVDALQAMDVMPDRKKGCWLSHAFLPAIKCFLDVVKLLVESIGFVIC
jgi:hypothetical protein